jgi:uncharacterized protein (TIGR03435 family)
MRTESRELLAVGIFSAKSRIGDRIEMLLRRGRTFSARASATGITASAVVLAGLAVAGSLVPRWIAFAQPVRQEFEAVSVKACAAPGGSPIVSPGRLNTGCAALAGAYPMAGLIQRAYGRLGLGRPPLGSALPISGGPAWIYSDFYVINAETPEKANEKTMEGPMLQAVLENRFRLKVHRETRQVPVYALTVARGGPKLQAGDASCITPNYSAFPQPPLPPGKRPCDDTVGGRKGPNATLNMDDGTVDYFCKLLGLMLDRPIVDKTGIRGKYGFHLEFATDQSTPGALQFGPPAEDPSAPSIFTAVQQLGLKLEATRGPREFLVIDHVERPSEN